jgi:hypothetical protein
VKPMTPQELEAQLRDIKLTDGIGSTLAHGS